MEAGERARGIARARGWVSCARWEAFPACCTCFVPLALVADLLGADDVTVFILTALAMRWERS